MLDVEELLKMYTQAHVIVTSRLHTRLPSVAVGTPAILIHKEEYEKDRLETFLKYVDSYVDTEFLSMDISELVENPKANNEEYMKITNNLNKICEEFIENSQNEIKDNISELPEIDEYKKKIPYLKHNNNLYEKAWRKALDNIYEMDEYFRKLQEANIKNERLQAQLNETNFEIEQLKQSNAEMNNKLARIYNNKLYKGAKKVRDIFKKK